MNADKNPKLHPALPGGAPSPFPALTRDEINALPVLRYEGPVFVVKSQRQLGPAFATLEGEKVLGFDIEIRPSFRKGESYPPALLQLAGASSVFIFQLAKIGLPRRVRHLLSDPDIVKTGVALANDVRQLRMIHEFDPAGFVELATLSNLAGIASNGLRGLAATVLGHRISKKVRTSNWAQSVLSESQISYAATDAWAAREIYIHLLPFTQQTGRAPDKSQ